MDFYLIESRELFPMALLVDDIWISLNFMQKELITSEDFYKNSADYKKMEDPSVKKNMLVRQNTLDLIEEEFETFENLTMSEFSKKLDALEIIIDIDTTSRLFKALTLGKSSTLSCTSFEIFIDTYQAKDEDLQKVNKYLPTNKIRTSEFALKISNSTVVPKAGIGRIALTQKCLYFLEQGTNKRKLIVELKNIKDLKKESYKMFQVCIKIVTHQDEIIYLPIQEERNLWYLLINELCSGIYLSDEFKDPSLQQYAAKNVLLIDCVFRSGLDSRTSHFNDLHGAVECLNYYTTFDKESSNQNSTDAKRILHLRLNPFNREFQKFSIDTMVHVSSDETLWCGIGNRIKIYEAIMLSGEIDDILFDSRIVRASFIL